MTPGPRALAVLVVGLLSGAIVASTAEGHNGPCAHVAHPGAEGIFAIRATGTTCVTARTVVYGPGSGYNLCHATDPIHKAYRCTYRTWHCQVGPATSHRNYAIPVRCTKGKAAVTWYEGY